MTRTIGISYVKFYITSWKKKIVIKIVPHFCRDIAPNYEFQKSHFFEKKAQPSFPKIAVAVNK